MSNPMHYVIDLGIDGNLGVESGSVFPLQQGLVAVEGGNAHGTGAPQWYTRFRQKDTVAFRLWDITGESSGELSIASFAAYFLSPTNTTRLSSPLAAEIPNPIIFSEKVFPFHTPGEVKSSVFVNPHKGWLLGADTAPLGKSCELEKQGRYLLRIEVVVIGPSVARRTYVLDPEMVVGSSDGGGTGDIDP